MNTLLMSFINSLESLLDKPSLDVLKRCMLEMGGRPLPIEEYISFSDREYKRNLMHLSSKCEVRVLCFKEGQNTPIHDHGGSIGVTIIREGIMTEELFNKHSTGMIFPTLTRGFRAGELACTDLTTIHRVSNAYPGGLVTINIYFPPLTLMHLYNLENNRVETWVANYSSTKGS